MADPSLPFSHPDQNEDPQEQSHKQSSEQNHAENHSYAGDMGNRFQVPVLYSPKASTQPAKALKDYHADVAEHLSDEDVKLVEHMFQVQQLTLQKLVDLKVSRFRSSLRSRRASTGSTSPATTSEAAIHDSDFTTTADLSCDAVTAIRKDLDDFKAKIMQSLVETKQSCTEHKESHFGLLETTSPVSPSTDADPPDLEPLSPEPQPDPYSTLPPQSVANRPLGPDKFLAFVELWDRSQDYSGELYDLLDDKVREMLSLCYDLGIKASHFHAVFRRILTGSARAYYVHYVNRNDTFATAYKKVKDRFDDDLNHRIYHTDWTEITFESFRKEYRAEHPGPEDLQKVLQSMLDKFQLCQRALGPTYAADIHLRDAVWLACRGVPAFHYAYYSPLCNRQQPSEEFFSLLRSSLHVHLESRVSRPHPSQRMSDYNDC